MNPNGYSGLRLGFGTLTVMRACVVCTLLTICAVPSAMAVPVCAGETLSDFIAFGTEGCAFGDFTLKNFDWRTVRISPEYDALQPEEIAAFITGSEASINVSIAANFLAVGNEFVSYRFSYLIDPPPVIIRGFEEELETFTPSNGGVARISTLACAGGLIEECDDLFQLSVFYESFSEGQPPSVKLFDSVLFPTLVNMVDVQHLIRLDANGGIADFSGFIGGVQVVPEPASFFPALLALALFAFRRRTPIQR